MRLAVAPWMVACGWALASSMIAGCAAPTETDTESQAIYGPIMVVCPLASCSRSGFRFGDNWTVGAQCPSGTWKRHTGIDLRASAGNRVSASAAGTVKLVYSAGAGWAQAVLIEHRDAANRPYVTQYMHIVPAVRAGQTVQLGEQIGTIASISAPHLHFGVWDGAYAATASIYRGALPVAQNSTCSPVDPAFPQSWINPTWYISTISNP